MSFDYLIDTSQFLPDVNTTPLQPSLIFHSRNIFGAGNDTDKKRYQENYFSFIQRQSNASSCLTYSEENLLRKFGLHEDRFELLSMLPENSWWLNLNFTLETAYIARDDTVFSPTENPPRIEKIIGLPYVSSAAWKGLLRGELITLCNNDIKKLNRLFGTDQINSESEQNGQQGRLCFFPTFFNKIAVDMINPHKRETKTDAHGPIKFEVVPPETKGKLEIVYIPFGSDDTTSLKTSLDDLKLIGDGVKELLLNAGISAKRNIGYGIVKDVLIAGSFVQINNKKIVISSNGITDTRCSSF